MRLANTARLALGAPLLALAACGSGESATPASVVEATTIDFANVANYSTPELPTYFDLDYHVKHVDTIFARVFGAHP